MDDLVFLPANLSRLVIDPYREPCNVSTTLGGSLPLEHPFVVTGFDGAPSEVFDAIMAGLAASNTPYLGSKSPGNNAVPWLQIKDGDAPDDNAMASIDRFNPQQSTGNNSGAQRRGLLVALHDEIAAALRRALDDDVDFVVIDGSGDLASGNQSREMAAPPDLARLRDAIAWLRAERREEAFQILYYGGVRSGTDGAKLIGLGANVLALGTAISIAVGGQLEKTDIIYSTDRSAEDRSEAVANVIKASVGEASMMARCTGKTNLQNIEPEDLRAVTIATASASGIPMVGRNS